VFCHQDPDVTLTFDVLAGSIPIVVSITSAQLSFPSIDHAGGRTSASVSLTDLNNDGAQLNQGDQNGIFTSRYNGAPPGGTDFHDSFLDPIQVLVPGGSVTQSDAFPGAGYAEIAGAVSDIGVRYSFALSLGDEAAASSIFTVQPAPAPASLLTLLLAGLLSPRRPREHDHLEVSPGKTGKRLLRGSENKAGLSGNVQRRRRPTSSPPRPRSATAPGAGTGVTL